MQVKAEKTICECKKESYNQDDFEFCIYCGKAMCLDCATYQFEDGLDEPVCKKCKD